MSLRKYGTLTTSLQAGRTLAYASDGLITGQVTLIADIGSLADALALVGTAHPDNAAVTLHSVTQTQRRAQLYNFVFDCIGIAGTSTAKIAQGLPQLTTAPIETHPDFETFAGTPATPLNGAAFDPDTGEFLGFMSGSKRGVRSYYTGSMVVRATHYTTVLPSFTESCKIKETLAGIPEVEGVTNWLYSPPSWEEIPNTDLYKVTEEWVGSTAAGWDADIYGA